AQRARPGPLAPQLQLGGERFDPLAALAHGGLLGPGVLTPALGQADGLRGFVAEGLEVFALTDEPAALGIELDQLGDEVRAPLRGQRAADRIGLLADQPDVKHDATGLRPARCSPSRRAPT